MKHTADSAQTREDAPLYAPSTVRDLLNKYSLRADKAFGQNFLIDGNVLRAIAEAGEVGAEDTVLEIGPGLGVLTRELAARAKRVVSVELDARLLPVLAETVGGLPNVEVVHEDGLRYDLDALPAGSLLVANLPYNVATPIIMRALESLRFKRLVFLVQKEVAQRLVARPGDAAFGALSLRVQHYGTAAIVRDIKPSAFFPAPEVTSSLVRLSVDPAAKADPATFALIEHAFRHRRKTLHKNLTMAGFGKKEVLEALGVLELDGRVRAEKLTLTDFRRLSDKFS